MPRRKPPDKKLNPEKYAEYYENYFVRTGEKLHARSNRKFRLEGATVYELGGATRALSMLSLCGAPPVRRSRRKRLAKR